MTSASRIQELRIPLPWNRARGFAGSTAVCSSCCFSSSSSDSTVVSSSSSSSQDSVAAFAVFLLNLRLRNAKFGAASSSLLLEFGAAGGGWAGKTARDTCRSQCCHRHNVKLGNMIYIHTCIHTWGYSCQNNSDASTLCVPFHHAEAFIWVINTNVFSPYIQQKLLDQI